MSFKILFIFMDGGSIYIFLNDLSFIKLLNPTPALFGRNVKLGTPFFLQIMYSFSLIEDMFKIKSVFYKIIMFD